MDDVFCKIISGELPCDSCYQDDNVIVFMTNRPDYVGHLLVVPKKHVTTILDMDDETMKQILDVAKMMIKRMEERLPNFASIKSVVNYGEEQSVKHFHLHLIPMYKDNIEPDETQESICEKLK